MIGNRWLFATCHFRAIWGWSSKTTFHHFLIRVLIRNRSLFATCHFLKIWGWSSGTRLDHFLIRVLIRKWRKCPTGASEQFLLDFRWNFNQKANQMSIGSFSAISSRVLMKFQLENEGNVPLELQSNFCQIPSEFAIRKWRKCPSGAPEHFRLEF